MLQISGAKFQVCKYPVANIRFQALNCKYFIGNIIMPVAVLGCKYQVECIMPIGESYPTNGNLVRTKIAYCSETFNYN